MTPDERIARLQALLGRMLTRAGEPRRSSHPPTLDASAYDGIQDDVLQGDVDDDVARVSETDASLPPISRPPFTPPPPAWSAHSSSSSTSASFDGEVGTLVSRASLDTTPSRAAPDAQSEQRRLGSYELELDAALAAGDLGVDEVEDVALELQPDDDDHAVQRSALARERRVEDPQEVTDVFVSRSRLVAASRVGSEVDLSELENLGEAADEELSTAIELDAFGEAPDSTRRPITTPPESGSQIASAPAHALSPTSDSHDAPLENLLSSSGASGLSLGRMETDRSPAPPSSMEAVLPEAQAPGEYRSDVYLHERAATPSPPSVTPLRTMPPVAVSQVERIVPRLDLEAKVGQIVADAPAFAPATFGELLEATLDL